MRAYPLAGVIAVLLGCAHPTRSAVTFDGDAVRALIRWARTESQDPPSHWSTEPAFVLTREWARWSDQPDPNLEVKRLLDEVASAKERSEPAARMVRVDTLLNSTLEGRDAFLERAIPHLASYLPSGTPIRGRVLFAVFIPPYAFAWDQSIVVNLTAAFWSWNPEKVFNLLVHELFHNGFALHQQGSSPQDARTPQALVENLLWQTQNEGLATYVAYKARPRGLEVEDYRLLDDQDEVRNRFQTLQKLLSDCEGANTDEKAAAIRQRLWSEGTSARAFYIVGASMARRIEEERGRAALQQTIVGGPRSFLDAYLATLPPTELQLRVGGDAAR